MIIKEFLRSYRNHGLPGAKKCRRRYRLELSATKIEMQQKLLIRSVKIMALLAKTLDDFRNESNWAEHVEHASGCQVNEESDADCSCTPLREVIWMGLGNPANLAGEALDHLLRSDSPELGENVADDSKSDTADGRPDVAERASS